MEKKNGLTLLQESAVKLEGTVPRSKPNAGVAVEGEAGGAALYSVVDVRGVALFELAQSNFQGR